MCCVLVDEGVSADVLNKGGLENWQKVLPTRCTFFTSICVDIIAVCIPAVVSQAFKAYKARSVTAQATVSFCTLLTTPAGPPVHYTGLPT